VDTAPKNSLAPKEGLFDVTIVGDALALSTESAEPDIHTHYAGEGSGAWSNYEFRGRMRASERNSGIGVTFLSSYPNAKAYYRIARKENEDFALEAHGTKISDGVVETGVVPEPDTWYEFAIQVSDTGAETSIQASIWKAGDEEPAEWQIDAVDANDTRLTQGTVGVWSAAEGKKHWTRFEIDGELLPLPEVFLVDVEATTTSLTVGDEAELRVYAASNGERYEVTSNAKIEIAPAQVVELATGSPAKLVAKAPGAVTVLATFDDRPSKVLSLHVAPKPQAVSTPAGPAESGFASSVTQHGITWTFDREYEVGRFVNGDWWVVGPVRVKSVTPGWDGKHHGSMIDPKYGKNHGYDARFNFDASLRASFPKTVEPTSSIVSVVSWKSGERGAPKAGSTLKGVPRPAFRRAAVLTVVKAPPAADSFRPTYAGAEKRFHNASDLAIEALPTLSPVAGTPTIDEMMPKFQKVWLDHVDNWVTRYACPSENLPNYGREIAAHYNAASLLLVLDLPDEEKRRLAIHLVQIGIDYYGLMKAGGEWGKNGGGLGSGRKWPTLLAGFLLDDAKMLSIGSDFSLPMAQEDCQTFFLTAAKASKYPGRKVGDAVWGEHACWNPGPHYSDPGNTNYQWCCTGNAWVGSVLACRILGLEDAWNHPPLFAYQDWFMKQSPRGDWQRSWSQFCENMWDRYRSEY